MRKRDQWEEECMSERQIEVGPGAGTIDSPGERRRIAERKQSNSEYFLNTARSLLETDNPAGAFILGHLTVEKKVEQALALKGFKVNTHLCTIKGLSRVLEEEELSKDMSRIYQRRQEVNYETEINETVEKEAEEFMADRVEPFIESMEEKIEEIKG